MQSGANPRPSTRITPADHKPTYLQFARITFTGPFPMDMLRYDHCFPVVEEHARQMDGAAYDNKPITVLVAKYAHAARWSFTPERWKSFTAVCEPTDGSDEGIL